MSHSYDDLLQLDVSELNFMKKQRGKKPAVIEKSKKIPEKLTRRQCVSKVSELFDITGKITPITACMKLDLHTLVKRKLQWDDVIPEDLKPILHSHFEMIEELGTLRFQRAVIQSDAVSLEVNTIDAGDSSQSIACVSIYARYKRRNGDYSCQLIFARSKLIPDNTSQPCAELFAAMLNAHTGEVVKRSLYKFHKDATKLTDSQIMLYWIQNREKPLKMWVRNRVVEILRLTDSSQWYYVKSSELVADIGTRRGANLKDVTADSVWINGLPWMKLDKSEFPIKSINDIKLDAKEAKDVNVELMSSVTNADDLTKFDWPQNAPESQIHVTSRVAKDKVLLRYQYSNYIIDPNRHKFSTVVRILAIVLKFIKLCRNKARTKQNSCSNLTSQDDVDELILTDDEINDAKAYFFKKATCEVKKCVQKKHYIKISQEKDDILFYTGRILPQQNIQVGDGVTLTEVMRDLSSTTFFVRLIDRYSPIAYAIRYIGTVKLQITVVLKPF